MTPKQIRTIKVICGAVIGAGMGLVVNFFQSRFFERKPVTIPDWPDWVGWVGWPAVMIATVVWVIVGVKNEGDASPPRDPSS